MMPIRAMQMRKPPWSPLLLPSIYAAYDPTDPTTLWQDAARTVPVTTHGDPVWVIDDITGGGHHLYALNSTARGFWQEGGGVLTDGVDDNYRESTTTMQTLTLPLYQALAWRKDESAQSIARVDQNASAADHHYLAGASISGIDSTRAYARLRSSVLGSVNVETDTGQWAIGDAAVVDSLAVPGTHDVQINNNTKVSVANTWTETSEIADARIGFSSGSGGQRCYRGLLSGYIVARADPGAMRANAKAWLAARGGVTL